MTAPAITFEADRLAVRFTRYDLAEYDLFLKAKALPESDVEVSEDLDYTLTAPARFAALLGVRPPAASAPALDVAGHLYDDQAAVLGMSLEAKRFAVWCDCGWGKTPLTLEWARHVVARTGGKVLIVTLSELVPQWLDEAAKFYGERLPLYVLHSRQHMRDWMKDPQGPRVGITNYEKWNPEGVGKLQEVREARHLAGVALDESSRLKTGGGKQKWALIKSCRGVEYKLSCTATPAPNDFMEFASQAAFLEKLRSEGDILWTYFRRDPKTHRWTVKTHAREAFFKFMASWSIYIRDPRRYGWRAGLVEVPRPTVEVHKLPLSDDQRRHLRRLLGDDATLCEGTPQELNAIQGVKVSQLAKGFRYVTEKGRRRVEKVEGVKPAYVADLVAREAAAGLPVLAWTVFDAEAEILGEHLAGRCDFALLTGKTPPGRRQEILARFKAGDLRVLVSRASVLGFGMNLQMVGSMVFSGWTYGYEAYYQAVRRAYRHGQTRSLRVHVPVVPELEGDMLDTIFAKEAQHEAAIAEMERNYIDIRKGIQA